MLLYHFPKVIQSNPINNATNSYFQLIATTEHFLQMQHINWSSPFLGYGTQIQKPEMSITSDTMQLPHTHKATTFSTFNNSTQYIPIQKWNASKDENFPHKDESFLTWCKMHINFRKKQTQEQRNYHKRSKLSSKIRSKSTNLRSLQLRPSSDKSLPLKSPQFRRQSSCSEGRIRKSSEESSRRVQSTFRLRK